MAQDVPVPPDNFPAANAPGEVRQGTMNPAPPLNVSVQSDELARAGGRGSVYIPVVRNKRGKALRDLRVRVQAPKGTSISRIAAPGWRCDPSGRRALCTAAKAVLPAGTNPQQLYAVIAVKRSYKKANARITATATWRGSGVTRSQSSTQLAVYRPFSVKLSSAGGNLLQLTTNHLDEARQIHLAARIRGLDAAQADARWTQLSGPRVTFLQPTRVQGVREQVGQIAQIPNTAKGNDAYRFALRVDANGQVVRKTIRVRTVTKRALGRVDANNAALTDLAAATREPTKTRALRTRISNGVRIAARPGLTVPAGKSTTLRLVTTRKVRSITWFEGSKQIGSGPRVRVWAPAVTNSSRVVRAHVQLRNGTGLLESALVRAGAGPLEVSDGPAPEDKAAFCAIANNAKKTIANQISVDLGGVYSLVVNSKDVSVDKDVFSGKDCTGKGAMDYKNAVLKRGSTTLMTNVAGKLTVADGLAMDSASWFIPNPLKDPNIKLTTFDLTSVDRPVQAKMEAGKWQLPDGTFAIKPIKVGTEDIYGLKFVPLPGGWAFDPTKTQVSFLNANPDEPNVKDATLRYSQQATGPQDATAAFTADSNDGAWQTVKVEAANISLGQTAAGDSLSASGSGTIALAKGQTGGVEMSIQCLRDGQATASCEIAKGFVIKDFTLRWTSEVIGIVGTAGVRYGSPEQTYEFSLAGAYKSPSDWTLAQVSPQPWALGDSGLTLSKLAGSVGVQPLPNDKKTSKLFVQFTGTVSGITPADSSFTVKSVTGTLTTLCPQDVGDCQPGSVRVELQAPVTAAMSGKTREVPMTAGALLDLTKMTFKFNFGFEDVKIGPDELNVNQAQIILTNAESDTCKPKGARATAKPEGGYTLQIQAQGKLFGGNFTVGGTWGPKGYCLWGSPEKVDFGEVGETTSQVFGFTSYPNGADLRLPTGEQQILAQNTMQLAGKFDLPRKIDQALNIDGAVDYAAVYTTQTRTLALRLAYTPRTPAYLYGSVSSSASLTVSKLGFSISGSPVTKQASLFLDASGSLFMKGGNGTADSTTPLKVRAGFTFDKELELELSAAVDTSDGSVSNAFGQPGLTVNALALKLTMTLPKPAVSVAFNGDVVLPDAWGRTIGIAPGVRDRLSFSLGSANWCLAIEIGEQSTATTTVAVDLANKGFLQAGYFKLVIAPTGCKVPIGTDEDRTIDPGFGFAFIGTIVEAPVNATVDANWQNGLVIKGDITIPQLDIMSIRLGGSTAGTPAKVVMDIDSKQNKYDVKFDVGLAIGAPASGMGGWVAIKGELKTSDPDFLDFSLSGSGGVVIRPIQVQVKSLEVKGHIAKDGKNANKTTLNASGRLAAGVLGITVEAFGDLSYEHQQLSSLRIGASATIDFWVGAVNGTAEFNYCLGTLTPLKDDGTGSRCQPYSKYVGASPAYRVGFYGWYRILWSTYTYTWTAYDQRGAEGSAPPPPDNTPKPIDGLIPPLPTSKTASASQVVSHAEVADFPVPNTTTRAWVKSDAPAKVSNLYPACDVADLGGQWKAGQDNQKAQSLDPAPGRENCTLGAFVTTKVAGGPTDTYDVNLLCTPDYCQALDAPVKDVRFSIKGDQKRARDALIAGLRSPLGVTANDTWLDSAHPWYSPNEKARLTFMDNGITYRSDVFNIYWLLDSAGPKLAKVKFTKNGYLAAYDAQGQPVLRVGQAAPLDAEKFPPFLQVRDDGIRAVQRDAAGKLQVIWDQSSAQYCNWNDARWGGCKLSTVRSSSSVPTGGEA